VLGDSEGAGIISEVLRAAGLAAVVVAEPGTAAERPPTGEQSARATSGPALLETLRGRIGGPNRPDVVLVVDKGLASAADMVRRGGAIASLADQPEHVPIVTLVQRELTVLQVRDLSQTAQHPALDQPLPGWSRTGVVSG